MAKIVLAHGILGFGSVSPLQPIDYFNGIYKLYTSKGHDVLTPTVPALGSVEARSAKLQQAILERWPSGTEPIFLLAHSMGGLDCRHMLATNNNIASRVRRLVTIATPHYGSPVADNVSTFPVFPSVFMTSTEWVSHFFSRDVGALQDLRTRKHIQYDNVSGIDYLCIGCNSSSLYPKSPFFELTEYVGNFGSIPNDGLVSLSSASYSNNPSTLLDVWSVDHGGAIGWPSGGFFGEQAALALNNPPAEHIARYTRLLAKLV